MPAVSTFRQAIKLDQSSTPVATLQNNAPRGDTNRPEQFPGQQVTRLAVPGGWLCGFAGGCCFLADPNHRWDPAADPRGDASPAQPGRRPGNAAAPSRPA